jgi:hypothetical protein
MEAGAPEGDPALRAIVKAQCREPSWLENIELGAKKAIKRENIDPKYGTVKLTGVY